MLRKPISAPRCLGSACNFQQCLCAGSEQEVVERFSVLQRQHIEFVRHGEHDVEVAGGEQLALACCEPVFARLAWHFGQCRLRQEL